MALHFDHSAKSIVPGKSDIQYDNIGGSPCNKKKGFFDVTSFANDVDILRGLNDLLDPLTDENVVIHDDDTYQELSPVFAAGCCIGSKHSSL